MSQYLADFWQKVKDDLTVRFLTDERFQLTPDDRRAVEEARDLIGRVYKYKVCHVASCAFFGSGEFKHGAHVYCRRLHEFSQCAEARIIEHAEWADLTGKPNKIMTLATFHGSHDKLGNRIGKPQLISPCPRCLRLLEQVSPDVLIVVDLDGQGRLAKIPLEAIEQFRHPLKHNGE